jgi:hypothetical protein
MDMKNTKNMFNLFVFKCENCSVTLREEHRNRLLADRLPRKINLFQDRGDEVTRGCKKCIIKRLIISTIYQVILG